MGNGSCPSGKPADMAHICEPEKANIPYLYSPCREEYVKPSFTDAFNIEEF